VLLTSAALSEGYGTSKASGVTTLNNLRMRRLSRIIRAANKQKGADVLVQGRVVELTGSACKTIASPLHGRLALSNTILCDGYDSFYSREQKVSLLLCDIMSSPKIVEAKAPMQHAVSPGLVEPAERPVPIALLVRSEVKDADQTANGHSVPRRRAPNDGKQNKADSAHLLRPLVLTPAITSAQEEEVNSE
jgi:hypothetical protein